MTLTSKSKEKESKTTSSVEKVAKKALPGHKGKSKLQATASRGSLSAPNPDQKKYVSPSAKKLGGWIARTASQRHLKPQGQITRTTSGALQNITNPPPTITTETTATAKVELKVITPEELKNNPVDLKKRDAKIAEAALEKVGSGKIIRKDEFGIKTKEVTVKLNGEDHKAHVKQFAKGDFHGVKTNDFRVRQKLIFNSSKEWVKNHVGLNLKQKTAAKKGLNALNKKFKEHIQNFKKTEAANFNKLAAKAAKNNKFDEEYEKTYMTDVYKPLRQVVAQYEKDSTAIVNQAAGKKILDIDTLDYAGYEYLRNHPRPIIINTCEYGGKVFVDMQVPASRITEGGKRVNGTTIPSFIRTEKGLVNYVMRSFGTRDKTTGEVTIKTQAVTQSGYSAKSIEDDNIRRAYTYDNVIEGQVDAFERKLLALKEEGKTLQTSKENPATQKERIMVLLTTGKGDTRLRNRSGGKWTGDAEGTQLRDITFALTLARDSITEEDIGKFGKHYFQNDISVINLGSNIGVTGEGMGKLTSKKKSEQLVNSTGFVEYERDIEEGLTKIEDRLKKYFGKITKKLQKLEDNSTKAKGLKPIQGSLAKIIQWNNRNREMQADRKLEERVSKDVTKMRKNAQPKLAKIRELFSGDIRAPLSKKQKAVMKDGYRFVANLQDDIGRLNQEAVDRKSRLWTKNKREIREFNMNMNNLIDNFLLKSSAIEPGMKKLLKTYQHVLNNQYDQREIYHEDKYKQPGHLNKWQALYIETHQLLGTNVRYFCKSGEDRTGQMDNTGKGRQMFMETHNGHTPREENDFGEIDKKIAPVVNQYSTSRDNTEFNSGAPGLQISPKANPEQPHLYATGNKNGNLAKNVPKLAMTLKPSQTALDIMKLMKV